MHGHARAVDEQHFLLATNRPVDRVVGRDLSIRTELHAGDEQRNLRKMGDRIVSGTDDQRPGEPLRNLRSLGLHLAVDDFGTGYSSLTYLKRFPVEAIKIDRGFVAGLGLDTEDTTIVEAVVNLGHSFGIAVVAEGLETPLQLARLRELGCDRGQGYLFGRPRPASIVEAERV